jgi:hypothetical protein
VFGLVVIWLIGREFSDRTAKALLALPTSRDAVVAAKLLTIALANLRAGGQRRPRQSRRGRGHVGEPFSPRR